MSGGALYPNTCQVPNWYFDVAMQYLTPEEWKVLSWVVRHILGWREHASSLTNRIALSQIAGGANGELGGTGLHKSTVMHCLESLVGFGLLEKVDEPTHDGQLWRLVLDEARVDLSGLQTRSTDKKEKARQKAEISGLPHRPEENDPAVYGIDQIGLQHRPPAVYGVEQQNPLTNPLIKPINAPPEKNFESDPTPKSESVTTGQPAVMEENPAEKFKARTLQAMARPEVYWDHSGLNRLNLDGYPEDVRGTIARVCQLFKMSPPACRAKGKKCGQAEYWIRGARDLMEACGELGVSVIERVYQDWDREMDARHGIPPFTVASPNSICQVARATAGVMRGQKTEKTRPLSTPAETWDFSQVSPEWEGIVNAG